ncbi:hypothetical protein BKE30_14845 [Alkanindiges hydrocarboniclasticus]|uniref:HTH merR-type domain-containing protein n=1 Tax=Alkanindiges hydrocarboniclasticus TaxID=1907941 RepID=A0A1S8CSN8_9GAMM|nr:MerR family transcriptional regulator [Alkanindiges hydrocarboniclasticus]ONG37273.1 hypothetical protein BKE30_14845 [Alkanindiges hydrocarboniclasticus]
MYIGMLASQSQCSTKAIRLYEQLGLLGKIPRQGIYRVYTAKHLLLLQLIKQGQALGFKLSELKMLLTPENDEPDWQALQQQLEIRQQQVQLQIAQLQQLTIDLASMQQEITQCLQQSSQSLLEQCQIK